jgi:uncharacterized membrane protein
MAGVYFVRISRQARSFSGPALLGLTLLSLACTEDRSFVEHPGSSGGTSGSASTGGSRSGSGSTILGGVGGTLSSGGTGATTTAGGAAAGTAPASGGTGATTAAGGAAGSASGGDSTDAGSAGAGTDDLCSPNPCQNRGQCSPKDGSCSCVTGFSGDRCEREVHDCSDEPCQNGGRCANKGESYVCTCKAGYDGDNCEVNVDDCADSPCKNGGRCVDGVHAHTCECKDGYDGVDCTTNIDDCSKNPCGENGTCVDGVAAYTCQCDARHTGPACEFIEFKLSGSVFGDDSVQAMAISGDGSVVLLQSSGDEGENVARFVDFDSVSVVDLGNLKAGARWGFGISGNGGVIAGQALSGESYLAFQFKANVGNYLSLSPPFPSGTGSIALDVSADGSTIVGSYTEEGGVLRAFRSSGSTIEYVDTVGANESDPRATAVSGDGSVVAGMTSGSNALPLRAWRWNASTKKTVNLELASSTWLNPRVADISKDGNVVVGSVLINGVLHAVRWVGTSGKAEDLGPGTLLGTNADGSVSVGSDKSTNAAVWTSTLKAKAITDLLGANPDIGSAMLFQAVGVSEDGKVVAGTAYVDGSQQAWVAHLP